MPHGLARHRYPPYVRSLRARISRAFVLVTVLTLGISLGVSAWGHFAAWEVALVAIPIAGSVGSMMARVIVRRLTRLRDASERLDLRDLSLRVPVEGVDEVAQLAVAFNRMAERLEAEERVRREAFADIAHELRHPLAVLQGSLEAIQDGAQPLEMRQVMLLQDQTLALSRLVSDLRDLSLADLGQLQLALEEVNLEPLLMDVLAQMEPVAQPRGIVLRWEISRGTPLLVHADPGRLRQVLLNLLANALHYTPAGGRVEIGADAASDAVRIWVFDTGSGIEAADLPHIFDRFYRTDRSRSRVTGGTGLGLAIVRSIVELHGGRIEVSSELGRGSRFTVTLPSRKRA